MLFAAQLSCFGSLKIMSSATSNPLLAIFEPPCKCLSHPWLEHMLSKLDSGNFWATHSPSHLVSCSKCLKKPPTQANMLHLMIPVETTSKAQMGTYDRVITYNHLKFFIKRLLPISK